MSCLANIMNYFHSLSTCLMAISTYNNWTSGHFKMIIFQFTEQSRWKCANHIQKYTLYSRKPELNKAKVIWLWIKVGFLRVELKDRYTIFLRLTFPTKLVVTLLLLLTFRLLFSMRLFYSFCLVYSFIELDSSQKSSGLYFQSINSHST